MENHHDFGGLNIFGQRLARSNILAEEKLFQNQQVKCNHNLAGSTFHPTSDTNENPLTHW